ncbi:hypothetical protein MRS60_15760 [Burkholderia pyrrocinia]|nr:hypothetical protein [Burkholderia pyrrocinia]UOB55325.1 hypothetical protein MRS60_15760 [Burkholderia pyrrocinia]
MTHEIHFNKAEVFIAGAPTMFGHWPSAGIAGMVSGGLGGAFAGFTGGPR